MLLLAGSDDSITGGAMIASDLIDVGFSISLKIEESAVMYPKIEEYGYYNQSTSYDDEETPI